MPFAVVGLLKMRGLLDLGLLIHRGFSYLGCKGVLGPKHYSSTGFWDLMPSCLGTLTLRE